MRNKLSGIDGVKRLAYQPIALIFTRKKLANGFSD